MIHLQLTSVFLLFLSVICVINVLLSFSTTSNTFLWLHSQFSMMNCYLCLSLTVISVLSLSGMLAFWYCSMRLVRSFGNYIYNSLITIKHNIHYFTLCTIQPINGPCHTSAPTADYASSYTDTAAVQFSPDRSGRRLDCSHVWTSWAVSVHLASLYVASTWIIEICEFCLLSLYFVIK
jgi:hypothetical protein